MVNSGAEHGLARALVDAQLDQVAKHLRRSTVFFAQIDEKQRTMTGVGSGVVADLHGTKVILTAGHVLKENAVAFADGRISLSVHRSRGHMVVRPDAKLLTSPGDHLGADAGVVILPADHVETYFQFSGVEPIRASTIRIKDPPVGMDCVVAGYREEQSERSSAVEVRFTPAITVLVADFRESDSVHQWLHSGDAIVNVETAQEVGFHPGYLNGMSGCGFWSIERTNNEVRFALHGVHTGTEAARLRETPIAHHLRLLAEHSERFKQTVASLWPSVLADVTSG